LNEFCYEKVTDSVHSKGSFIYQQLWALGRSALYETVKEDGHDYVSASDIPMAPGGPVPRPLTKEEIKEYVELYAQAAENSLRAGFDGVEIHACVLIFFLFFFLFRSVE
jgi:NADPH2 dehydrogenase